MSTEWFNRVTAELQDHLNSLCDEYDKVGQMTIDQSAKHPRIEFFVETEDDDREFFCTLLFDPHNEEFYIETFDFEFEMQARIILSDIEDVIDAVHESFHSFMNGDSEAFYVDELDEDDEDDYVLEETYVTDEYEDGEEYYIDEIVHDDYDSYSEEPGVEWESPEVTAFHIEDEVEITYQFGLVGDTGHGVLKRVNRYWIDDELHKDESIFTFSKEEASTMIAMIASHMDKMTEYKEL